MHNELPRLPRTTRKAGPKDGSIQPPLQRRKSHLHVRRAGQLPLLPTSTITIPSLLIFQSRTSSRRLDGSIVTRQVVRGHGHDGRQTTAEHLVPMGFPHRLAMVGSQHGFGSPFLLEEGSAAVGWGPDAREVVEVVFRPGLPDFLRMKC